MKADSHKRKRRKHAFSKPFGRLSLFMSLLLNFHSDIANSITLFFSFALRDKHMPTVPTKFGAELISYGLYM